MLKQRLLCINKYTNLSVVSWILGLFFFLCILNSCTIQNRVYMKGVYINHRPLMSNTIKKQKLNVQVNDALITSRSNTIPLTIRKKHLSTFLSNEKPLFVGDSVKIELFSGTIYKGVITKSSYDGYFIEIKNKREIYVSNIEIKKIQFLDNKKADAVFSNDTIRYNTELDSSITKADYIIDDYVRTVDDENNYYKKNDSTNEFNTQEAKLDPYALIGFISAVLGFITVFSFILSIIFSSMSLKRIKESPSKYKGKGFAIAGLILSISALLFAAILITLIIAWLI